MTKQYSKSNIMVIGATGSGKTYAIRTFLDAGITPFVLATEPGIEKSLGDIPEDKLHWQYIAPAQVSFDTLISSAKKINTLSYEALSKMGDMNKRDFSQFIEVLTACNDFTCDRTGESFGNVQDWGTDRVLVLDSLSGLNIMAMDLVVGSKPTKAMQDWMVAQDNLERFLTTLVVSTKCHFVLTAHPEKETDETTGGITLMASTIGRKLAPRLPRFFDEVVHAQCKNGEFIWATQSNRVDLKHRNLPASESLEQDFTLALKESA